MLFVCIADLPSSSFLRTPFVPHSVLLRSWLGPMERRWNVGTTYKMGKKACHAAGGRSVAGYVTNNNRQRDWKVAQKVLN